MVTVRAQSLTVRQLRDPAREAWMEGYLKIEEAARAEKSESLAMALQLYEEAMNVFDEVKQRYPDWNQALVRYRISYCHERIKRLQMALMVDAEKLSKPDLVILVQRLRREMGGHEKETARMQKQLAANAAELKELRKLPQYLPTLKAARDQAKATIAKQEVELGSKTASLKAVQADKDELGRKNSALQSQLTEVRGALGKKVAELASVKKTQAAESATLKSALAAELATLKSGSEVKVAALQADAVKTTSSNRFLQEQLTKVQDLLRTRTGSVKELEALRDRNAEALTAAKKKLGTAEASVERMEGQKSQADAEVKRLTAKTKQEQTRAKEFERLLALAGATDLGKMENELKTAKIEMKGVKTQLEVLQVKLIAKEEGERRLIEEKRKRLEEEKLRRKKEREQVVRIHTLLKEAAAAEQKKDAENAIFKFKKVIELEPENKDAWTRTGLLMAKRADDVEAERYLSRAFELDPNNAEILLPLGFSLLRQEKVHLAIASLSRAAGLKPEDGTYHRFLGVACRAIGWNEAAEGEFRQAFKLNAKDSEAAYNLAVLLATLDDPRIEAARDWYKKARELGAKADPGLERALGN